MQEEHINKKGITPLTIILVVSMIIAISVLLFTLGYTHRKNVEQSCIRSVTEEVISDIDFNEIDQKRYERILSVRGTLIELCNKGAG